MARSASLTFMFVVLLTVPMVLSTEYDHDHYYNKKPKEMQITLFVHAITGCPNARFAAVAGIPGKPRNLSQFGTVYVADLLVTNDTSLSFSSEVGRAQGILGVTSKNGTTSYNNFSILFSNQQYNGSTLELQGIIQAAQAEPTARSELSVVSGTKVFRFVRGHATRVVVLQRPSIQYVLSKLTIYLRFP